MKITKKKMLKRIELLESLLNILTDQVYDMDTLITELSHALPCPDYDATNWQNSLIERDDIAKELAEVDLSSELTGSELCKAMLERGDKFVLCAVSDESEEFESGTHDVICGVDEDGLFESYSAYWWYVKPINNQGEPLTASEVGL